MEKLFGLLIDWLYGLRRRRRRGRRRRRIREGLVGDGWRMLGTLHPVLNWLFVSAVNIDSEAQIQTKKQKLRG